MNLKNTQYEHVLYIVVGSSENMKIPNGENKPRNSLVL